MKRKDKAWPRPLEAKPGRSRCAIYTRKSSEEGLEQSFNSLDAQREACECYVASQAGEGWAAIPTLYDDGGFSGGNMERPALKRLMADVDRGLIDVVVVYKVDRLTRSLADFAKIVERFDNRQVSFVSVTQAFNTTSSMGRLTLNVLLSFAQFEREVTSERIRDKIALSKAKGMWMGGLPPLGYDAKDGSLIVNETEAELVRHIFRRYLELGSAHRLRDELEAQGVRSKCWTTQSGRAVGGAVIRRGALLHMLRNRHYLGEIVHRDKAHPGRHVAIVDGALFLAVQGRVKANSVARVQGRTENFPARLTGKLFDGRGEGMTPTTAYGKRGRRYRYYVSTRLQLGDRAAGNAGIQRVSADRLEAFLLTALSRLIGEPNLSSSKLDALLRRVELRDEETQLVLDITEFGQHPELALLKLRSRLQPGEVAVEDGAAVRILLPVCMRLRSGRTWMAGVVGPTPAERPPHNRGLVEALKSSHRELLALNASPLTPASRLHQAQTPETHHRRQLAKLPFLAPDLQRLILEGREPEHVQLSRLLKSELPLVWGDQRAMFGSSEAALEPDAANRNHRSSSKRQFEEEAHVRRRR